MHERVENGIRERWDPVKRTYTAFDEHGVVVKRRNWNNRDRQWMASAAVRNPLEGFEPSDPAMLGVEVEPAAVLPPAREPR